MIKRATADVAGYAPQLLADVLSHAESEGQESFLVDAFADLILDDLETEGRWPDYQVSHFGTRGAAINAWGVDHTRRILFLAIADFEREPRQSTIAPSEIRTLYRRLVGFLTRAMAGRIDVADHDPVGDLLDVITEHEHTSVALYLLTNRIAPDNPPTPADKDVPLPLNAARVWDLETIRRSRTSGEQLDPICVDFTDLPAGGVPCLTSEQVNGITTHLAFIPGHALASIYQEHGGRLLERNVRAFLSARGKVNRGIRDTLRNEAERFVAYNNGLTATAAEVHLDDGSSGGVITSVEDLQIVNGGQTTASLAAAAAEGTTQLDGVLVQVKLVEVAGELLEEMVPHISRFANQQNAVQQSDLSSNHEYLRSMQEASRTEWTPATASGRPTKWYFERARGSYDVDRSTDRSAAGLRRFDSAYPKPQKFSKNDLAVFENTWACLPHYVSRGGQKNFFEFMARLPEPPTRDADPWYRARFRDLIAKAIVFKATDRIVRTTLDSGYKRQVVAYTLANILHRSPEPPDLAAIWASQEMPVDIADAVHAICGDVKRDLIDTAGGRNVAEWAKNDTCWEHFSRADYEFEPLSATTTTSSTHGTVSRLLSTSRGLRLADAIEQNQGVRVEGTFRRYRRPKWRHLGDTGVAATGGQALHAYAAPMTRSDGEDYIFNVVVDVMAGTITPVDRLPGRDRSAVVGWLDANGFPQ